jgi:DNA polymerase-4
VSRTVVFAEVANFYASVERSDDAEDAASRPVIVGGDPRKRGLVAGASPEALAAGVKLDMQVVDALKLCPGARATRTDMGRYREVSRRLFSCMRRGMDGLETYGLGGAYFEPAMEGVVPADVADRLRSAVADELGLPLRVGIGSGKLLARLAAEEVGVDGVMQLSPEAEIEFLSVLPVTRLEGVGDKTAATLAELGVRTIGELRAVGRERLQESLGPHGLRICAFASGIDDRPVRVVRHAQSLSREASTGESLDLDVLTAHLLDLSVRLEGELRAEGLSAARVAVKVRFADRSTTSRSQTLGTPIRSSAEIHAVAGRLLARTQAGSRPCRGIGITLGRLGLHAESDRQLDLFPR